MVKPHFTQDERTEETYEHCPMMSIGPLSLFPNPFQKSTYYVTNKRVLESKDTLFSEEINDVPLDKILSISHSSEYRLRYLLYAALASFSVFTVLTILLGAIMGRTAFLFGVTVLLSVGAAVPMLMQAKIRGAKIQTANPDVGILLPPANNRETEQFINTVRQKVEDFEQ